MHAKDLTLKIYFYGQRTKIKVATTAFYIESYHSILFSTIDQAFIYFYDQ